MQLPNLDVLREHGTPQWFGLGFIQLKVSEHQRYHFWHPDLAPDVEPEEIHNHRYGFTSHILRGSIRNELFSVLPCTPLLGAGYISERVSCKEGEELEADPVNVNVTLISMQTMRTGCHYSMNSTAYHRTIATEKSVTALRREPHNHAPYARVVRMADKPRVCPFSNKIAEDRLWEYIEDCLNDRAGYHLADIEKGELGHASKIVEEAMELLDAHNQGSRIMAAVELSDLYGAMKSYMMKSKSGLTFDDLEKMSAITERAFRNGHR